MLELVLMLNGVMPVNIFEGGGAVESASMKRGDVVIEIDREIIYKE